ncbi:MAG: phytanoyl-CoA dioxygenase family protein [Acidimicrobiales bacterium]
MGNTTPHLETAVPDLLADADRLAHEGHGVDAIRHLTEANRSRRDDQIEERLVMLRHDVFASLSRRPPESRLPEVVPEDPTEPLRHTDRRDLTVASLCRELARHGCVLLRGLIAPERAEAFARGIDRALAAFDGCEASGSESAAPWYVPFAPPGTGGLAWRRRGWVRASGGLWTADSPRMLFELMELLEDTGIGSLVEAYFGEQPALSANKCTLRRVPTDTNTNWHQDGAFLGRDVRSLNLWMALSPCGVDAPGLDIVPRRFDEILPTGTEGALFDWSVSPTVVEEAAGGADAIVRPEFEPGDALLFDHMFLHRTGVSPGMTRERWAIENWFFAPSSYPDGQIPLVY